MTDEAINAAEESRISRRNALKAAAGVGIGAVAWTGPQITSFGATPAYASGCTNFTFKFEATDLNTNASGCGDYEMYQNPSLESKIANSTDYDTDVYYSDIGNGQTGVCADPGDDETKFNFFFPEDETCTVTIRLYYASQGQGSAQPPWYGVGENTGSGGSVPITWAAYENVGTPPANSSLRWGIWIECFKTVDAHCYTPTPVD